MSHPAHLNMRQVAPPREGNPKGIWDVAFPPEPTGWAGWRQRRQCRKRGGHWWHPADAMIEWRCCACGASRDGMPKDGT
jgi:hypothetical protein